MQHSIDSVYGQEFIVMRKASWHVFMEGVKMYDVWILKR